MAGRGMGAASRGGGAVTKGQKNRMVSEPSKSTGKVLMMAKGGVVPNGTPVRKFSNGGSSYVRRSGPTSREATGPTSGRATYFPNPFGKSIKVYTGPTGGSQPRVPSSNPRDLFGNENPNYSDYDATRALEELRENREPVERAKGGAVYKRKVRKGGVADKKGRAMKKSGKDARGRAMRGR